MEARREYAMANFIYDFSGTIKMAIIGACAYVIAGINSVIGFLNYALSFMQLETINTIAIYDSWISLFIKCVTLGGLLWKLVYDIYNAIQKHRGHMKPGGDGEDGSSGVEPPEDGDGK